MTNDALREPVTHELKCWPESFQAVLQRWKTAEYRLDDRGFRVGDFLFLREFDPMSRTYLGGEIKVRISHVYRGAPLPDHFALLSIEHLDSAPPTALMEAAREIVQEEEEYLDYRQSKWDKRIDCRTGKLWKGQKCKYCQEIVDLIELSTREGDWREGIRPDYLCPKCNGLLGCRKTGTFPLGKRPEKLPEKIEALRSALAESESSPPSPGLVEAAREILPRLEAIIADGPDCGCEDLGHVCGWREFVVEVGHLRSALASCQAEPPHPGLIEAARKALESIDTLIAESHGVDGLHRNGDIAPWDELLSGGRFEEWLRDLEPFRDALAEFGEWERVTEETPESPCACGADDSRDDLVTMCWAPPTEDVLAEVEHLWPGAVVMRPPGKKGEEV